MERLQVVEELATEWIVCFLHTLKRPSGRLDERLQPSHIVHRQDLPARLLATLIFSAAA